MISFGFVWTLIPLTKKLCSSIKERQDFLNRHLLSFNANPYLANFAVGAIAKLEEKKTPPQQIIRFKDLLRGPLGALGDSLIWQNLRPTLLVLGIVLAERFGLLGALCFWLIFNLHQIYLRARALLKGYALGLAVSSDLNKGYLQNMTKWSGRLGGVLSGILLVSKLNQIGRHSQASTGAILFFLFTLSSFLGFKKNLNPGYLLLLFFAFLLVMKLAFPFIR